MKLYRIMLQSRSQQIEGCLQNPNLQYRVAKNSPLSPPLAKKTHAISYEEI
jgi:hypothetical protein